MKKEFILTMLLAFLTAFSTLGQSKNAIHKIDSIRMKMQQYAKENQFAKVADFYTGDAVVNGFDGSCSGISEIREYWKNIRGKGVKWEWTDIEYSGTEEYVTQTGTSLLTLQYGEKTVTYTSLFSVVWQKQADGNFKITSDFYRRKKGD